MTVSEPKLCCVDSDIDKVIAKHDELLEDWRAHRAKQDADSPETKEKDCSQQSVSSLEF